MRVTTVSGWFEIQKNEVLGGPDLLIITQASGLPIQVESATPQRIADIFNAQTEVTVRLDFGMTPMLISRQITREDVLKTIEEFNKRFTEDDPHTDDPGVGEES